MHVPEGMTVVDGPSDAYSGCPEVVAMSEQLGEAWWNMAKGLCLSPAQVKAVMVERLMLLEDLFGPSNALGRQCKAELDHPDALRFFAAKLGAM